MPPPAIRFYLLATQREQVDDEPAPGELYDIGTKANIVQLLKMPDGTAKLLIEGVSRSAYDRGYR
ncbi:MAG: LON peptidase substrate-binding domain-containing protein [bacterium]